MRGFVIALLVLLGVGFGCGTAFAQVDPLEQKDTAPTGIDDSKDKTDAKTSGIVRKIEIRAPRDIGYFQGDMVTAFVEIYVDNAYKIIPSSLPQPGPVNHWLDIKKVDVDRHGSDSTGHYTLKMTYQEFYVALDARQQEIPGFPVEFTDDKEKVVANVPAWTIGVSPLREIAPPPQADPKNYMRPDERAPFLHAEPWWIASGAAAVATLLALLLLAYDRLWWPFRSRPTRVFAEAQRKLQSLAKRPDGAEAYLEGLLVLHRGIDHTDGQRVLSDDVPRFLDRHPAFAPQREGFARFFAASRFAFFGSDPERARRDLGFGALQGFARQLASIERSRP